MDAGKEEEVWPSSPNTSSLEYLQLLLTVVVWACATQVSRKWQKTEAMLSHTSSFLLLEPPCSEASVSQ